MKVFISWSGDTSKAIAQALADWLPHVIQSLEPFFSPHDIATGTRWSTELAKELEEVQVGLICLTRDNLSASWIMFEAGALSKMLDSSKVCPLLFGIDPSDVTGPLTQFQMAKFEKPEISRVLQMLNAEMGERRLKSNVLTEALNTRWPILEASVKAALETQQGAAEPPKRSQSDILEEILQLTRAVNISGARSPESFSNAAELVEALEHMADTVLQQGWQSVLRHCLVLLAGPVFYFAQSVGDDQLCKKVIVTTMKFIEYLPDHPRKWEFDTRIPAEAVQRLAG